MIRVLMFDEHSEPESIQYQLNELIKETNSELIDLICVSQSYKGLNNMQKLIYTLRFKDNEDLD